MFIERTITVRLCEARESFIYTVRVDGIVEDTKEIVVRMDAMLSDGTYYGGSEVLD